MREKTEITLTENGEDLRFQIEKMPAFSALMWRKRALSAVDVQSIAAEVKKATKDGNGDFEQEFGMRLLSDILKMPDGEFELLLEGLISCCYIVRGGVPVKLTKTNIDGFFTEADTLMTLCMEAFKANGFFPKGKQNVLPQSPAPAEIKRKG